ncbi:hypothetical protein Tco_0669025 [Tanacetum coccineum]
MDKKDSGLEEMLDDLFKIGAENLKQTRHENVQNSICKHDVDNISDLEKEEAQEEDEEFEDEILNVTMVDEEADCNPTKDIEELERLIVKDP